MAFTVGLTGGIASGKSSVGRLFEARGVSVIDADALARALTAPGGAAMPAIVQAFGRDYVDASGALDRAKMRATAFADPARRKRLEAILHPLIRAETDRLAAAATSAYVMLMIPLLVESKRPRERCDRIVVVDVTEATQLARVIARDGLAPDQARAIIAAQATRAARLAEADDVVDNSGPAAALAPQVDRLHRLYDRLAADAAARAA
jgi:dephospho-CoA kinase